jgi:ubiquinone/menaquinone biosynthesis C-methylase UbiE
MDEGQVPARSSDFSSIADRYDATRGIPKRDLAACYDRLREAGLFPTCGIVLDAGCGTGQISSGLQMGGYDVLGADISEAMLRIAQSRRPACYFVSDVQALPVKSGSFDAIVVSKLFQHVGNWQTARRELIRVAKPGAPIVQINERGAFGNAVRRWFSRRADELGFSSRFPGLDPHTRADITAFMAAQGCSVVVAPPMPELRWETTISYGEALSRIAQRLYAEFWCLPPEVHDRLVAATAAWVDAQPEGRGTIQHLSPYLAVEVFRTPFRD